MGEIETNGDEFCASRHLHDEMEALHLDAEKLERVVTAGLRKFLAEETRFPRLGGLTEMLRFLVNPTCDEVEAVQKDADAMLAFYDGSFGCDDRSARVLAAARASRDHATLAITCYRVLRDDGASQASVVLGDAVSDAMVGLMAGVTRDSLFPALLPKSEKRLKAGLKACPRATPAVKKKAG